MKKKPGETTNETTECMRPEQVNKWPNSMIARWWWWWWVCCNMYRTNVNPYKYSGCIRWWRVPFYIKTSDYLKDI